jgi:hypothetical protein
MTIEEVIANPTVDAVTQFINTLSTDREQMIFKAHMHREGVMTPELEALFPEIKIEG